MTFEVTEEELSVILHELSLVVAMAQTGLSRLSAIESFALKVLHALPQDVKTRVMAQEKTKQAPSVSRPKRREKVT